MLRTSRSSALRLFVAAEVAPSFVQRPAEKGEIAWSPGDGGREVDERAVRALARDPHPEVIDAEVALLGLGPLDGRHPPRVSPARSSPRSWPPTPSSHAGGRYVFDPVLPLMVLAGVRHEHQK